ncbi:ligand-gated channel protein [Vibrio rumoiensis]|uniref:Outer membrane siderophore receptor n=1 Tax=Vibrio rumoiensis 1S-45 TaxID=1188252 RepID=A0A1E5E4Y0_9VIBR|nr:ligand-gated channel protein [Vibrio rumoiensis]OEF28120.1 outer membrane siderophore receptor [Vibrio rumoiensis 1S-45]
MSRYHLPLSTLAGAILLATNAQAAEKSTTETMVVTASGYEQSEITAPASISVVTREELDNRYYRDVTDALRNVPGVTITGGGDKTDISIRGMGSAYTLILVDGKRQSSRQTRPNSDGPGIEQGWLPPIEAIERIEVIRGPMSTLYGSDAIGGVINVITRKDTQHWTGNVQIGTTIQENRKSGDERSANFYLTGPISDKLTLQVNGQTTVRDEDQILNGYEDKSLNSIDSTLTYQANDDHQIAFEAGISEQDREGTAGNTLADGSDPELDEYNRQHYSISHQGNWGKVGRSNTYLQYEDSENTTREMESMNTVFNTSLVTPIYSHTLTTGFEFQYEKLEDYTSNQASDLSELDNNRFAVFLEDEWAIVDSFSLTLGARLDDDERYGTHISPRAYGVWSMTSNWVLKGGVSTGYRAPSLREITPGWAQVSRGGNIYGNENLTPETSVNTEISLNYQNDYGVSSSVTLFNNDFKDKISRVSCTSCGPVNDWGSDSTQRVNIDKAVTRGVEVTLSTPLSESVYWNNSYTFTHSEQKSGDYAGQPLVQLPKHLFSTDLSWQATADLETWAQVTYHGEEMEPITGPSSSSLEAPSYTFVDMGMSYQLTSSVSLNAAIYNLLDEEVTYDEYGYVEDGRRYWVGMNVGF